MHYIPYSLSHHIYPFQESMVTLHDMHILINNYLFLARIIDLQICAWLKQDPIESDRISTWIETHRDVFQFDRRVT
jgi:hypothetical protein